MYFNLLTEGREGDGQKGLKYHPSFTSFTSSLLICLSAQPALLLPNPCYPFSPDYFLFDLVSERTGEQWYPQAIWGRENKGTVILLFFSQSPSGAYSFLIRDQKPSTFASLRRLSFPGFTVLRSVHFLLAFIASPRLSSGKGVIFLCSFANLSGAKSQRYFFFSWVPLPFF